MNWWISWYLSTSMSSFILSTFVSIIEHWQKEISAIINSWLYVLLVILKNPSNEGISLSHISTLMLKHEYNINTTARDVILRFFFLIIDIEDEKPVFDEWSHLMIDTYDQLKQEGPWGRNEDQHNVPVNWQSNADFSEFEKSHKTIKKYFGELEIWGLIIISYYSLIYSDSVDSRIARWCSKMIILLSWWIVSKCKTNKNYIHLLSILLQLLSTGIKIHHKNYENVKILEDIIKLLLCTYNFYKPSV